MSAAPILFADFEPGVALGEKEETLTSEQLDLWVRLYGGTKSDIAPRGMVTVFMMRAYLGVVTPRPPGNLHVRQTLQIHSPLRVGEALTSVISCAAKTMKGERRQLDLAVKGSTSDGRKIYDGVITLYWAA